MFGKLRAIINSGSSILINVPPLVSAPFAADEGSTDSGDAKTTSILGVGLDFVVFTPFLRRNAIENSALVGRLEEDDPFSVINVIFKSRTSLATALSSPGSLRFSNVLHTRGCVFGRIAPDMIDFLSGNIQILNSYSYINF